MTTFAQAINLMIQKKNLSYTEMSYCFERLMNNQETEMNQGAFLAALAAKGETPEEIRAVWEKIMELDTVLARPQVESPVVENSGTGMDSLKTFNISTLAALCAASAGVNIARHGSRAITSSCGTVDILEQVGVGMDVEPEIVRESIEKTQIGLFNGTSPLVHPAALGRILSQISFGSVLNIAASLANPAIPDYAVRGVGSPEMVKPVAEIMQKIGIKKALVVHGLTSDGQNGMDEASILGETHFAYYEGEKPLETGSFCPEDLGITRGQVEDIQALGNAQQESRRFLHILAGRGKRSQNDIVALNSGLILHLSGQVRDLKTGYQKSLELLGNQQALGKLRQWIAVQNRVEKREQACARFDQLVKAM